MRWFAIVPLIAVAACATAGTKPLTTAETETVRVVTGVGAVTSITASGVRAPDEARFNASRADVWAVLPAVYDSLGVPVTERNAATYVIGNPNFRVRRQLGRIRLSRYFDCGSTQSGSNADGYDLHLTIVSQAQDTGDGKTVVRTRIEALAKPVNFATDWFRCSSTSSLESRIVELVNAQLIKRK